MLKAKRESNPQPSLCRRVSKPQPSLCRRMPTPPAKSLQKNANDPDTPEKTVAVAAPPDQGKKAALLAKIMQMRQDKVDLLKKQTENV